MSSCCTMSLLISQHSNWTRADILTSFTFLLLSPVSQIVALFRWVFVGHILLTFLKHSWRKPGDVLTYCSDDQDISMITRHLHKIMFVQAVTLLAHISVRSCLLKKSFS
jgi:hypothetical protein